MLNNDRISLEKKQENIRTATGIKKQLAVTTAKVKRGRTMQLDKLTIFDTVKRSDKDERFNPRLNLAAQR